MKILAFIVSLFPLAAMAAQPPNGPHKPWLLSPADISVNAATLDATVNSSAFNTTGWSQMTVACEHTNNAATEIQIQPQHTTDNGTTWTNVSAGSITLVSGVFTDELSPYRVHQDVSGDLDFGFTIGLNYLRMRLQITDTAGGASDTISCYVILGAM